VYVAGHAYNLMSDDEVDLIHHSALRILEQVGMEVQSRQLLEALRAAGGQVDWAAERVRFPPRMVERFVAAADKHDWDGTAPHVGGSAGVYHGMFHDPYSGELVPWSEEALARYFALANHLPHISGASMLGCRLPVPGVLEPLYERYYCWKYGAAEAGTIHLDALCPYLLELYQALADERGVPLGEVFRGTVYLVPPLKLGRHEAYQVAYFWERGLRVHVGDMYAMGASAPVTLAGAVALNLAEQLALRMLDGALYGGRRLHLGASISVMDMRTTIYPYGRPEMAIANLMTAQMARHYGASFSGHAGLTDAKLPSVEAGAQKALTALPTLLAGGSLWLDAGLLSIDEVCSPLQMVLDNEFLGALKHLAGCFPITEEAIGLETILEAGPGGHYLDKMHTVRYLRSEHWQPSLWSRKMLRPWMEEGRLLDVDRAREVVREVEAMAGQREQGPGSGAMSEALEREVLRVIERARAQVVGGTIATH
jgi:trimethylamine--corrinoid protein Co-methyltransferase